MSNPIFVPGWGQPAYVIFYTITNLFIPLLILLFCYGRICHAIWDNFNNKAASKRIQQSGKDARATSEGSNFRYEKFKNSLKIDLTHSRS